MPRDTYLYWALRSRDLDVEYIPGWTTRGSSTFAPFGDIAHWTAGPTWGDRPSLNVVVHGHGYLPGPLCNCFLPRGLTAAQQKVVLVAAGRANHAGRGSYKGATGNTHLYGTEAEWSGAPGELTEWQKWAYPRIHATYHDRGSKFTASHQEFALPRGRKVDIGLDIHWLRDEVDNILRQPPRDPRKTTVIDTKPAPKPKPEPVEEASPLADVSKKDADLIGAAVAEAMRSMYISGAPDSPGHLAGALYRTQSELMRLSDQVEQVAELQYAIFKGDDKAADAAINAVRERAVERQWLTEDDGL